MAEATRWHPTAESGAIRPSPQANCNFCDDRPGRTVSDALDRLSNVTGSRETPDPRIPAPQIVVAILSVCFLDVFDARLALLNLASATVVQYLRRMDASWSHRGPSGKSARILESLYGGAGKRHAIIRMTGPMLIPFMKLFTRNSGPLPRGVGSR